MVKVEVIGMYDVAKINPVLKSESDVANHSFITIGDELYLIDNIGDGDDMNREGLVIKAGEYLNGYLVKAWEGQKLVVDGKHITGGVSELDIDDVLVVGDDGKLEAGEATGIHFVVTDKTMLTEAAVKVKVVVA